MPFNKMAPESIEPSFRYIKHYASMPEVSETG